MTTDTHRTDDADTVPGTEYPTPAVAVDWQDVRPGDVIRNNVTSRLGIRADECDYYVHRVDATPHTADGRPFQFPAVRLHVTLIRPPATDAPADETSARATYDTTRIVDGADILTRADRRRTGAVRRAVGTYVGDGIDY